MAAMLLVAVGVVTWWQSVPVSPDAAAVARVQWSSGPVELSTGGRGPESPANRVLVRDGSILTSGEGFAMLIRPSGLTVRVDQGTVLSAPDNDRWMLERGRIYVETGDGSDPLAVETPAGLVRHIGTRFMAEVHGMDGAARTVVTVREGEVLVEGDTGEVRADVGEQVTWQQDRLSGRTSVPLHGPLWAWLERAVQPFAASPATLHAFLEWAATANDWELAYQSDAAESLARQTSVHGVPDLPPSEALPLVLQTSDLEAQVQDGQLLVSEKQHARSGAAER